MNKFCADMSMNNKNLEQTLSDKARINHLKVIQTKITTILEDFSRANINNSFQGNITNQTRQKVILNFSKVFVKIIICAKNRANNVKISDMHEGFFNMVADYLTNVDGERSSWGYKLLNNG